MRYPGQKIIEQLTRHMEDTLAAVEGSMVDANAEVLDEIRGFIAGLKKNSNGTLKASVDSIKSVAKFRVKLLEKMQSGEYGESIVRYLADFKEAAAITNSYFAEIVTSFRPNSVYRAVLNANVETTVSSLLGSGLEENYVRPITDLLQQAVAGQSDSKALMKSLSERLEMDGQSSKWVKQQTSDSLMQFQRNYSQTITDDLGLDHFLYAGTEIKTTRPFCESRVGKVFTRKEVEKWADLEWSGKVKGTDKSSIYVYVGGYACRHRLIPIIEDTYNALKTNS